jgi:hypothetical protein
LFVPDSELKTGYYGVTGNIGFGTPGGEIHIEWGETITISQTKFNFFDVARSLYHGLMEW